MKRTPKPFVVERKRRARGATDEPVSIWSDVAGRALRQLMRTNADADDMVTRLTSERSSEDTSPTLGRQVQNAASPRILDARPLNDLAESREPLPSRGPHTRGQSPRNAVPDDPMTSASGEALPSAPNDTDELAGPTDDPAPPSATSLDHSSYRDRRREARKQMPPGQRWRWNLRY